MFTALKILLCAWGYKQIFYLESLGVDHWKEVPYTMENGLNH